MEYTKNLSVDGFNVKKYDGFTGKDTYYIYKDGYVQCCIELDSDKESEMMCRRWIYKNSHTWKWIAWNFHRFILEPLYNINLLKPTCDVENDSKKD